MFSAFQFEVGAGVVSAYLLVLAIYNKFFHPLSSIPGPFLCAITWFPWYKYWFSGHMYREVLRLHKIYGPVVRLGPSEISFIDAAAWKDIYSLKRCREIERCPESFPAFTPHGAKFDLLSYNPLDHTKYRKILNPCLSEKATKEYEPTVHQNTDKMIARLLENVRNGESRVNITNWLQWLTFDTVGDVIFGEPFDCISQGRSHPCLALSMELVPLSSLIVFVAWWKGLKNFLVWSSGIERMFMDMVRSKCQKNFKSSSEKASVFSNLTKNGSPLNLLELDGNLSSLVIAGSETTGFAVTATSFYLAKNPEWCRKVATEVRSAFSSEEEINDAVLRKLPYLRATIEETLRLTPAEPNGIARKVVAEGIEVMNHYIPKGTAIYVSQWAANHHSSHFHLPEEYRPERWLNDPEFANDRLDVFQPFLMGVNVCIGKSLAWMEMRVIIAKLLWNFNWTMDGEDQHSFENSKAWHVWVKSTLHLKLEQRSSTIGLNVDS